MTKYIIKKDLLNPWHELLKAGEEYHAPNNTDGAGVFLKSAIEHGFIEEVKEDTRWRADQRSYYYDIRAFDEVRKLQDINDPIDQDNYDQGNYFKSQETANKVADALRLFFEYLHTPDSEDGEPAMNFDAFYSARRAVLADDKVGTDD